MPAPAMSAQLRSLVKLEMKPAENIIIIYHSTGCETNQQVKLEAKVLLEGGHAT